MSKYYHLNYSERLTIEGLLAAGNSIGEIAKNLGRSSSCITREILINRNEFPSIYSFGNDCEHVESCRKLHVCGNKYCNFLCRSCRKDNYPGFCHKFCKEYKVTICKFLTAPPYVCNCCSLKDRCIKNKSFYDAKTANKKSEDRRSKAKNGTNLSNEEIKIIDEIVTPLVRKGQPLAHIYAEHKSKLKISLRSLYRLIEKGLLRIKNIDLRRKVGYKLRNKGKGNIKEIDKAYILGRRFEDFLAHLEQMDDDNHVVEMDTVIGKRGNKKRILTITFRKNNLVLLFLLANGSSDAVVNVFKYLEEMLGLPCFRRLFPVFLTDNGSEFKNSQGMETAINGEIRTSVYYCHPMASWEKGCAEKNHEYIRYVLPKGTLFTVLGQAHITLLMNHINSTKRAGFDGHSPMELALAEVKKGNDDMKKLIEVLKLELIPSDEVCLNKSLFKKHNLLSPRT